MTTFGDRLRRLRQDAGLSQTELAGDGLSPSYVSLLESGKRVPGPEVMALLARKLGTSTAFLGEGEPSDRERRIELDLANARLELQHGHAVEARRRLETLLSADDLSRGVRDDVVFLLTWAEQRGGDYSGAIRRLAPLFERVVRGDSHLPVTHVGMELSWLHLQTGGHHKAVEVGERAMSACREQALEGTEDYFRLAATLMLAYGDRGDDEQALAYANELMGEAERAGSRGGQAALYWNAALVQERLGRVDEALRLCRRAMAHFSELDDSLDLARVQVDAAAILLGAVPPRVAEARAALERTRPLLDDLGGDADLASWHFARSWAALLDGDVSGARDHAGSALERASNLGDAEAPLPGRARLALGDSHAADGDVDEAAAQYAAARGLLDGRTVGRASAYAWRELAERLARTGDHTGAQHAFRRALDAAGVRDRSGPTLAAIEAALAAATATAGQTTAPA